MKSNNFYKETKNERVQRGEEEREEKKNLNKFLFIDSNGWTSKHYKSRKYEMMSRHTCARIIAVVRTLFIF